MPLPWFLAPLRLSQKQGIEPENEALPYSAKSEESGPRR